MPKVTIDGKTQHFPYTKTGIAKAKDLKDMKNKKESVTKMIQSKSRMMSEDDE